MAQYNSNYNGSQIDTAVQKITNLESETASSDGNKISLVTTGEKYTWNNKLSASSFTNNNKGTSIEKVMVADASNGLGYSTPSDLASVLGVFDPTNWINLHNKNLNSISNTFGYYYEDTTNTPSGYGIVMDQSKGNMKVQLACNHFGTEAFIRSKTDLGWSPWKNIANNTIEFAQGDANDLRAGVYAVNASVHSNLTHFPSDKYGILICFVCNVTNGSSDVRLQLAFNSTMLHFYARLKWDGSWTSWKTINL